MKKEIRRPDGSVETLTGSPEEIRRYENNERVSITVEPVPWRISDVSDGSNIVPWRHDDQGCLIATFFRANPKATFCGIACPCPRCTPTCSVAT